MVNLCVAYRWWQKLFLIFVWNVFYINRFILGWFWIRLTYYRLDRLYVILKLLKQELTIYLNTECVCMLRIIVLMKLSFVVMDYLLTYFSVKSGLPFLCFIGVTLFQFRFELSVWTHKRNKLSGLWLLCFSVCRVLLYSNCKITVGGRDFYRHRKLSASGCKPFPMQRLLSILYGKLKFINKLMSAICSNYAVTY